MAFVFYMIVGTKIRNFIIKEVIKFFLKNLKILIYIN